MTSQEWEVLANRISGLWPPRMDGDARGAYFDRLERFTFAEVKAAIDVLADTTTTKGRPLVGAIRDIIQAQSSQRRPAQAAYEAPAHDVLDTAQHRVAMIEIRQLQTPEHRRRADAVMATGKRFSLAQLRQLLPESACGSDEFDRRLAEWEVAAPVTSHPEPVPAERSQRRLFGTDPEGDW